MTSRGVLTALVSGFLLTSSLTLVAQKKSDQQKEQAKKEEAKKKETADRAKSRAAEDSSKALKKWIDEDVAYIITNEERAAWKRLATDEERESFIENFWLRRDPTPDTIDNE